MRLPVDGEQAEQITGTNVVFNQRLESFRFVPVFSGKQGGRPNVRGDWFLARAELCFLSNFTEDQGRIDPTKTECIRNNMVHVFGTCSITHEVETPGLFHRIGDVETGRQDLIA